MTHQEKVDHFVEKMKSNGVEKSETAPLLFRLIWKLGFQIPPPQFINIQIIGLVWGLISGICLVLLSLVPAFGFAKLSLFKGILFGAFIGYFMALRHKDRYKKYGLPGWDDYPKESNTSYT
ncbi:MAG TPA: DUF6404 family protein [Thermodesulfobacteriota bacterium]|nr:DUF6404 family protein [Thermodesulfobacteriota bacterium]